MNRFAGGLDTAVTFNLHPGDPLAGARAEATALFFLAAWHRRMDGHVPLRVVCVNDPPDTVLSLAQRCRATVTVESSLLLHGVAFDQALGWAAPGDSGRRLVLSPEMLVLENFTPALAAIGAGDLSAAPAAKARIPDTAWAAAYYALGLPLPAERMLPLRTELGLPGAGEESSVLPCYHGAVVLAPRACNLGQRWAAHFRRLAVHLPGWADPTPGSSEPLARHRKISLATAFQSALADGKGVYRRLPQVCDGRLAYFEASAPRGNLRMLHAAGLFDGMIDLSQVQGQLSSFTEHLRSLVADGVRRRGGKRWQAKLGARWRVGPVEAALRRLYLQEVRPTLRRCGAIG